MKIDRHSLPARQSAVKLISTLAAALFVFSGTIACCQKPGAVAATTANAPKEVSQPAAVTLLDQVTNRIANGPAFGAKVRQRVWVSGREVVGVGIYEQSGGGTGRFHLHVSMHDGDGKHTLQQTSDGRLTWTRSAIGEEVTLRRVDVGRLNEWVRSSLKPGQLSPKLKIGGWTEMLQTIKRDYVLTIGKSHLQSRPVFVLSGTLNEDSQQRVVQEAKIGVLPALYPAQVKVAIAATNDAETGFGKGLPVRFEFWTAASQQQAKTDADAAQPRGRLVTLIELYSTHRIKPPPMDRFRLDAKDAVNFVNETDRYLKQYGIRLTEAERRKLLR